jgi:hypothetical protein
MYIFTAIIAAHAKLGISAPFQSNRIFSNALVMARANLWTTYCVTAPNHIERGRNLKATYYNKITGQ